jgi:hypothetical protein
VGCDRHAYRAFARYPRTTLATEIDAAMKRVAKRHPVFQFAAFLALGLLPFA